MRLSFTVIPSIDNYQGTTQVVHFDNVPGLDTAMRLLEQQHEFEVVRLQRRIEDLEYRIHQTQRRKWRIWRKKS